MTKTPPPYKLQGLPLMSTPNEKTLDMIEHAQSITVSVPYIEFADGTVSDPTGTWTAKVALSRAQMAASRARRGLK
jgi:hypothetical protein